MVRAVVGPLITLSRTSHIRDTKRCFDVHWARPHTCSTVVDPVIDADHTVYYNKRDVSGLLEVLVF
jgi:hypothetical protein